MDTVVLKSTGSSFTSFIRDEYTTLAEVDDRIFSTAVDLQYTFTRVDITTPVDDKKLNFTLGESAKGSLWDATGVAQRARDITLKVFAEDDSASVQATLYKMAQMVLAQNDGVQVVTYALPNKHYIPVDMRYIGVENVTPPSKAEVFMPIAAPSGLISAIVSRK
ncbi:Uricase [Termitomyces sp. T112]|nr:Uricase [Termitomyces sp. T112]